MAPLWMLAMQFVVRVVVTDLHAIEYGSVSRMQTIRLYAYRFAAAGFPRSGRRGHIAVAISAGSDCATH